MSTTDPDGRLADRISPVAQLAVPGRPPDWLQDGLCTTWGWDTGRTRLHLIAADLHASFLVLVDDLPVAVARLSVPPYMEDTAAAESEVAWMTDLGSSGVVRVPAVIAPVDGRDVALLCDDQDQHWICLTTTWVGDRTVRDELDQPGARASDWFPVLGATAARMHEHALNYHRPHDFVRPTWDTTDLVGPEARWGDWHAISLDPARQDLLERAEQAALDVLHHASRAPDAWGLVHADLCPEKLVVDSDGVTVIDFDNCGFSWFMLDLATALSTHARADQAADHAQAWADGYEQVRPLTQEDAGVACALVMLRQLQLLGRSGSARYRGSQDTGRPAPGNPRTTCSGFAPTIRLPAELTAPVEHVAQSFLRAPDWLLR